MSQPDSSDRPAASTTKTATTSGSKARSLTRRNLRDAQDEVPAAAASHANPARLEQARALAIACARIADDNRGRDIKLLDMQAVTSLVDYFVIVGAASRRQAMAMSSEIDAEMKRRGEQKLGMEGAEEGRWILIDYGDFIVHVFSEEAREFYALEEIWGDAPVVEWADPERPRAGAAREA